MVVYLTAGWDDTWRQEYLDGRSRTLLEFVLPPRIRRLLHLHSYESQADSDHLLEVNSYSIRSSLDLSASRVLLAGVVHPLC
jgi:hypothetical protein